MVRSGRCRPAVTESSPQTFTPPRTWISSCQDRDASLPLRMAHLLVSCRGRSTSFAHMESGRTGIARETVAAITVAVLIVAAIAWGMSRPGADDANDTAP